MRAAFAALVATLALAAPAAASSTVRVGDYFGHTTGHGSISFTLSHDRHHVLRVKIGGHLFCDSASVEYTPQGRTHFGTLKDGIHLYGSWSGERAVSGGLSWHSGGVAHHTSFTAFHV